MRVAGIMSGTSLDGIDVAIVDITRGKIRPVAFDSKPYPKPVREALLAVSNRDCHTAQISRLNFLLPQLYAEAFLTLCWRDRIEPASVELIGCHGQTIFHESKHVSVCGRKIASTLQIGDGSVLAELTGIPVVSDFRPRDMAAGGEGAPLVPYFDWVYFRHPTRSRVLLNIGGIANITWIPADARLEDVIAFDTGPGNMAMDQLVTHFTQGRLGFDTRGQIAARGHVISPLLGRLLRDPFYRRKPPKSAGREQYGSEFVAKLIATRKPFADLVATVTALTAETVAMGIRTVAPDPSDLIVGGGGARNETLMGWLSAVLPETLVSRTTDHGIDSDAKEAIAFALLAYETWRGKPSNVPSATGARRPVVLGKLSR